ANVVATEITDWFNGLWHGKRLAFTVACLTVFIAGAFLLASISSPPDPDGETSNRKRPEASDARCPRAPRIANSGRRARCGGAPWGGLPSATCRCAGLDSLPAGEPRWPSRACTPSRNRRRPRDRRR